MNKIEIPKDKIVKTLEVQLMKELNDAMKAMGSTERFKIEKIEWTEDGITLWTK